jgi:hypothetical protein
MNQSMQRAIQHLFQVSSLEAVSRERLETLVEEYPCFGFGHYLLSHKLRVENSDQFLSATQKTNLYFQNPFWLQWMLENAGEPASPATEVVARGGEPFEMVENAETQPQAEPWLQTETQPQAEPWPEMETSGVPAESDTLQPDPESPVLGELPSHNGQDTAQPAEAPIQDEEPPFVLDETDQPSGTAGPAPVAEPKPVVADNAPLFEPLHTIDYFASQGIRLTFDENPSDQLGRQLKSFTDWLRTMRRLPQQGREIVPDRVAEQTVQNFAAHSIEGKEPVTETMAEVLVKQGMPDRARLVYEKLSLLNPDKSAYFAAKIEQLNSH